MKKILFFPGAFNPPHLGHVKLLEEALKSGKFDEVWIMPSGNRKDKNIHTSYEDRRELNRLFVEYLQSRISVPVRLITLELDNSSRTTDEILKELKEQTNEDLIQLAGKDSFDFLSENNMLRPDEKFLTIDNPLQIRSTQIREMAGNGDMSYLDLVPETIAKYIEEHNLYSHAA